MDVGDIAVGLVKLVYKVLQLDQKLLETISIEKWLKFASKWKHSEALMSAWPDLVNILVLKKSIISDYTDVCCLWHLCVHLCLELDRHPSMSLTLFDAVREIFLDNFFILFPTVCR